MLHSSQPAAASLPQRVAVVLGPFRRLQRRHSVCKLLKVSSPSQLTGSCGRPLALASNRIFDSARPPVGKAAPGHDGQDLRRTRRIHEAEPFRRRSGAPTRFKCAGPVVSVAWIAAPAERLQVPLFRGTILADLDDMIGFQISTPLASKPASLRAFVAFYEINNSLRKR